MNKSILNKLLACSLLFWLAGCAENKYTKTIEQLCPQTADKAQAMSACEQVLTGMHFGIEKFDVDAGYIRTAPLSGAQSFEFWRSDSVGSFNRSEADLHSIRRAVEINIGEQAGQLCINCKATTQRLSLPQIQNAAGQSRPVMSPDQKSLQKFKLGREQKSNLTWTNLGRDNQLETEILKRIESRLTADKKQLAATKKEPNK
ncbi:MAG: hypothetical protein ABSG97_09205 [Sedimentisphaerales bacterium]